MPNQTSYRQGDVLLIKIEEDENVTNVVSPVLAEGEVSGHKHEVIDGSVVTRYAYSGQKYVRSTGIPP